VLAGKPWEISVLVARPLITTLAAFVLVAAASAANPASTDKQLAMKLVVAQGDVPSMWRRSPVQHPPISIIRCLARPALTTTARASSYFFTPNLVTTGANVTSAATVFKSKTNASSYYRTIVRTFPACLRRVARLGRPHDAISVARPLSFPRYGDQSGAWWLGVTSRFGGREIRYHWVLVRTGRAVFGDLFLFARGYVEVPGLTNVQAEQEIVRQELGRARGSA